MSLPIRRFSQLSALVVVLPTLLISACGSRPNAQQKFQHVRESFLRGDLTKARNEAEAEYRTFSGKDEEWAWRFRLLEAEILLDQGSSQAVLSLISIALPARFASSDLAVEQMKIQGSAYAQLSRFREADFCLSSAEVLSGKLNSRLAGEVATARGVMLVRQNDLEGARRALQQSLQLARQQHDIHLEMIDFSNLGTVAEREEHFDEAIDWLNDSYRTAETLRDRHTAQVSLGNLAWAYYRIGSFDKALDSYQQAEDAAKNIGATYDQIGWLNNIGLVYFQLDQLSLAEDYYRKSLDLALNQNESSDLATDALSNLAFVSLRNGKLEDADRFSEKAFNQAHARHDRPAELYPLLVEGEVAAASGNPAQAEKVFFEVATAPESDLSLRWEARNDLAKLYEQEHQPAAADEQYLAALDSIERARASLQHEDYKLPFLANATHLYDDYVRFLVAQKRDQKALEFADYSRARTLAEGLGVLPHKTLHEKTAAIPAMLNAQQIARQANATILFYWLGRESSYLWTITANQCKLYPLPRRPEIDAAVQRYRHALLGWQDVLQTNNADGHYLYDQLVAPAAKLIVQDSRVILMTDGSLNNLNFETLLTPGPSAHYWIEDVTVLSASSLRMLAASQVHPKSGAGKLLLIGSPSNTNPEFGSLPYADAEMSDIEKHFPANARQSYRADQATPDAYLANDPGQFSFVHFVAHATASEISPLDSAIVLSRSSGEPDSYKLYAREITKHRLNANLVTISSCNGAGTKAYSGEGLVGLSWAFLRAGAHNVIGALWEVNDASTATLMDHLYDGLKRGRSPDAALRSAKLDLLHSGSVVRKPSYWAPFQLYTGSSVNCWQK